MKTPLAAALLLLFSAFVPAATWLFPPGAVNDLPRLQRQELFNKWNPQLLPSGASPSLPGSYVRYQHEALTYYFGIYTDPASARAAEAALQRIRQNLLEMDPKFETATVALVNSGLADSTEQESLPSDESKTETISAPATPQTSETSAESAETSAESESSEAPGESAEAPAESAEPESSEAPGESAEAPAESPEPESSEAPGESAEAPGESPEPESSEAPGESAETPAESAECEASAESQEQTQEQAEPPSPETPPPEPTPEAKTLFFWLSSALILLLSVWSLKKLS